MNMPPSSIPFFLLSATAPIMTQNASVMVKNDCDWSEIE